VNVNLDTVTRMRLKTGSGCDLGVGIYPNFNYNATGGGGWASVQHEGEGVLRIKFDPTTVVIPDLSWRTATIFSIPIPPPLNIAIVPQLLEGTVDTNTGEVSLQFDALFNFTTGFYSARPLVVQTFLTTGPTQGRFRSGVGSVFVNNMGRLAGTATVEKTGDLFMDTFLSLPTDTLAVLNAELEFE